MFARSLVPVLVLGLLAAGSAAAAAPLPYRNRSLTTEERVRDLVSRLTLEEKLVLLSGSDFDTRPIPRLGIPALTMTDGPNGVRWGKQATAYPVGIAHAAAWDPALVKEMGAAIAGEAKKKGRNVLLGPCVNISRVPQNGRNFECYGEDPFLSGQTAVGFIKGVQSQGVIATIKHFACNNQEHRRQEIDVRVDKRTLHEIYFPAFKAAVVEGGVMAVMAAYNKVNGLYSTENPYLIEDTLKKRWGFAGLVMSDWDAVKSTLGPPLAGLDLEMPEGTFTGEKKLLPLVKSGQIPVAKIDDKVSRLLWIMFKSGAFDEPARGDENATGGEAEKAISLAVARASLVLLKNDRGALPLEPGGKVKRVAVIGPPALYPRLTGGGSGMVRPLAAVRPLDALERALGSAVEVRYQSGYSSPADVEDIPACAFSHTGPDGKESPGLKAEYFNNKELGGKPVLTKVEPVADLHWSSGTPGKGVNADFFSSRFTGKLTPPRAGRYRFLANGNNGVRVFLDGKPLIDLWNGGDLERTAAELELAPRPYDIRIEHYENKGTAFFRLQWGRGTPDPAAAAAAAKQADAAVVFAGYSAFEERESADHELGLPSAQVALIKAVARANRRTIVVLNTGSPVLMEDWVDAPAAILEAWYPGQEGGAAVADVLTGKSDPAGRLPFTFPRAWKDAPAFGSYPESEGGAPYREGVFVGYRHYDARKRPVRFPFGHGLSYTRFAYGKLAIEPAVGRAQAFRVSVDVKNVGKRAGVEVVQLYVGEQKPAVPRPPRELEGFAKLRLAPGETGTATFTISADQLGHFDENRDDFVTRPGRYNVEVGSSSRDIRARGTLSLQSSS